MSSLLLLWLNLTPTDRHTTDSSRNHRTEWCTTTHTHRYITRQKDIHNKSLGKFNARHYTAPTQPSCVRDDATIKHAIAPDKPCRPMPVSIQTLLTGRLIGQRRRHWKLTGPAAWLRQTRRALRDALLKGKVEQSPRAGR